MTLQWCQPADISKFGVNPLAIHAVPQSELSAACVAATGTMAAFFRGRFPVDDPSFQMNDPAGVMYTAWVASYIVMAQRGYDPGQGSDLQIKEKYDAAIAWGMAVQRQAIEPLVSFSKPPGQQFALPAVYTRRQRGWS